MIADLLAALRHLRRSPMHVLVSTVSLGIGMAIAVAAFSVMKAMVFDEVPGIADRSGLVRARWTSEPTGMSLEDFEVIEETLGASFSAFAADGNRSVPVVVPSGPVTLPAAFLSPRYFETLGTVPARGRLLTAEDGRAAAQPVALISERLWRDSFERSEDVLGRTIMIGGRPFTIVGVTPAGFPGLLQRDVDRSQAGYPQVWLPLGHAAFGSALTARTASWLSVVARARPETNLKRAQAELATLGRTLKGAEGVNRERRMLMSFRGGLEWSEQPMEVAQVLGLFLLVPVSVLLIACGNVINLQLSRATERSRELGVRIALGASTNRLIRMLGIEAVLLSGLAGFVGWQGAVAFLAWAAPFIEMPVTVDVASLAFIFALVAAVIAVAGFAPAWLATRSAVAAGVRDVRDSSVGHKRLRASLVVAQVAVSLALLFVSARGLRTIQVWLPVLPPGADKAIVADFNLAASHPGLQDSRLFLDAVLHRLESDRTIAAAGFADFFRGAGSVRFWKASDNDEIRRTTTGGFVTRDWFEASGATFVAGRGFDVNGAAERDVVINEALASTLAGGGVSALGQTLRVAHGPRSAAHAAEVVGIVADRLTTRGRPTPAIYLPMPRETPSWIVLVARASQPASAVTAIKAAVSAADPTLPWVSLETLEARALRQVSGLQNYVWVGAWLGTVGLLLAAAGLHAVLTYTIHRRTHEIGIRMAVGADTVAIVRLVLRQALGLMLGGVLGGLLIAMPLVFVIQMFPDISPIDPLSTLTPLSMLLVVGVLAAAVPAYRAATVDPIVVLREP